MGKAKKATRTKKTTKKIKKNKEAKVRKVSKKKRKARKVVKVKRKAKKARKVTKVKRKAKKAPKRKKAVKRKRQTLKKAAVVAKVESKVITPKVDEIGEKKAQLEKLEEERTQAEIAEANKVLELLEREGLDRKKLEQKRLEEEKVAKLKAEKKALEKKKLEERRKFEEAKRKELERKKLEEKRRGKKEKIELEEKSQDMLFWAKKNEKDEKYESALECYEQAIGALSSLKKTRQVQKLKRQIDDLKLKIEREKQKRRKAFARKAPDEVDSIEEVIEEVDTVKPEVEMLSLKGPMGLRSTRPKASTRFREGAMEVPPEFIPMLTDSQVRDAQQVITVMFNSSKGLTDEEIVFNTSIDYVNILRILDFLTAHKVIQSSRDEYQTLIYWLIPDWESRWGSAVLKAESKPEEREEVLEFIEERKLEREQMRITAKSRAEQAKPSALPKPRPIAAKKKAIPMSRPKVPPKPTKAPPMPRKKVSSSPSKAAVVLPSVKPIETSEIRLTFSEKDLQQELLEKAPVLSEEDWNWQKMFVDLKKHNLTVDDVIKLKEVLQTIWYSLTRDEREKIEEHPYYKDIIKKIGLDKKN